MKKYNINVTEKLKNKIHIDTGIKISDVRQIKRGKLSKSSTWAFVVTTDSGVNIGSMSTMTELCNKKSKIEVISNGVSFDEFI